MVGVRAMAGSDGAERVCAKSKEMRSVFQRDWSEQKEAEIEGNPNSSYIF
jgi:hypothetical protein